MKRCVGKIISETDKQATKYNVLPELVAEPQTLGLRPSKGYPLCYRFTPIQSYIIAVSDRSPLVELDRIEVTHSGPNQN